MEHNKITISYTLPEKYVFERRRIEAWPIRYAKENWALLRHIKASLLNKQLQRTEDLVKNIYQQTYSQNNKEWYQKKVAGKKITRRDKGKLVVGNNILWSSAYAQIRSQIFNQLNCTSALEVGSGRGNNIIALASLNPDMELYGIELTQNGHKRGLEWEKDIQNTNMSLVGIGENIQQIDFSKIHFIHGNGCNIPLPDKHIDASFTSFVLEQIPEKYPQILREMRRVTRKYCVFVESFAESLSLADKINLKNRDYFRFSYKEFEKYGLRPIYFSTDLTQKIKFGSGLLITEVI